jgi:uncharacterized protein Usg
VIAIIKRTAIVFVGVTYYLPDYSHLVNEFYWQTEDVVPEIPRVHSFLNYWKNYVEATIKEVEVSSTYQGRYRNVIFHEVIN